MKKGYYIAYGSNLNVDQMAHRCPTARILGTATLAGWKLAFKGSKTGAYLTIDPCPGAKTPVVVWEVYEDDVESLDRYEGFPTFYRKEEMRVTCRDLNSGRKKTVNAFVYIMTDGRVIGVPSNHYVWVVYSGYKTFEFPVKPLLEAYYESVEAARHEA